jgi:hypothetical protein
MERQEIGASLASSARAQIRGSTFSQGVVKQSVRHKQDNEMTRLSRCLSAVIAIIAAVSLTFTPARAENTYTMQEIVDSGHSFFGSTSGGLATVIEKIFSTYGLPNGYILGEEGGGAFVGGLTYGEGTLYTKNAGDFKLYWQGPSVGWDFGGEGARTMMLVYNLEQTDQVYGRFGGVAGSAFILAGVGFNVLKRQDVLLVPVRTGVGARLGINIGYLKLTPKPTWNPF